MGADVLLQESFFFSIHSNNDLLALLILPFLDLWIDVLSLFLLIKKKEKKYK